MNCKLRISTGRHYKNAKIPSKKVNKTTFWRNAVKKRKRTKKFQTVLKIKYYYSHFKIEQKALI